MCISVYYVMHVTNLQTLNLDSQTYTDNNYSISFAINNFCIHAMHE